MKNKQTYALVQGGNVPGGHRVICSKGKNPIITSMKECNSIPLRYSDVVVDIGAYVGTYAIRCARFPVKKVIAYEPTPFSFEVLSKTKLINLKLHQKAVVGNDMKRVDLSISTGVGMTNSLVMTGGKKEMISVKAINYVKAVKDASIVKIDVEGAEYDYPIVQSHVRAYIIDFHRVDKYWVEKAKNIISDLINAGYETVIEPNFSGRGIHSGSWIKPWMQPLNPLSECEPLMKGKNCCGCSIAIKAIKKALCPACFNIWSEKHRKDYEKGVLK
jgi:FkbM family methyltransferase